MRKSGLTTRLRFRTPRARFPRELGNGGLFFASVLINAIGYGVYVPFAVLYFHLVVGLSLPLVGLGLTIATGVGLVMTPIGGPLIDQFGARNVALVTNLLGAIGFAAYLTVHSFVGFLTVALFLALGRTGAGTADQALVVDLAAPEVRDRWYAFVRMAFNAGAGAGALLASALVATGGTSGYRWVVALNGVSFALAAGLVFLIRVSHMSEAAKAQSGSYRVVLRDRPFLGLVGANAILWISVAVLEVGLPPYLIVAAHAPARIVGMLFALNTGMIVALQMPIVRALASWRRTRAMAVGGLGWGLSFLLLAAAPFLAPGILPFYLCGCVILYTLAEIIYAPTSFALAAACATVGSQGRYLAVYQISIAGAATFTPIFAEALLTANPPMLWLVLFPLMGLAALLIYWLGGRLPDAAPGASRSSAMQRLEQEVIEDAKKTRHLYLSK